MGKLLIFSAPSGSGKTTIVRELMARFNTAAQNGEHTAALESNRLPGLEFSISATSRAPRGEEKDGVDYHFLTAGEFRRRIDAGDFVEWEEVYEGTFYGTLRSEVESIWARGNVCVFDVDVAGGVCLKQIFGRSAMSFFIMAPSAEELRRRLVGRGTDSPESIGRRLAKADSETRRAGEFDHIVVNGVVADAVDEISRIAMPFLARRVMLFFGSFNPVHRAHIAVAETAVERGLADMVVMVVSPQNPFKPVEGLAPEYQRFTGVESAARASKYPLQIQASAIEMTLPRPSYTIDTLRFLETEFPETEFSILMGADNAARLKEWKSADEIMEKYQIFVYPRDGAGIDGQLPGNVHVMEGVGLMDVSATEVRRRLESGRENYKNGAFGAAANDFARVLELAPDNTEAAEFQHIIDEILNFRNTDLLNP